MTRFSQLSWGYRRVAFVLTALALAMQALVPVGYMISKNGQYQGIAITICTVSGNVTAYLNTDGDIVETKPNPSKPSHESDESKSPCSFAAQSIAVYDPESPTIDPQSFESPFQQPLVFAASTAPGRGLIAPPPPKTGPPIQV
jgi:hypothetical protein